MHANEAIIEEFYRCFKQLDGEGMAQCYHEDIVFNDPVFQNLKGPMVGNMWKMLCSQAQGFELTYSELRADDTAGNAHWEAKYLFSRTGRNVHNKIDASFVFKDGKIIQHHDDFDFWKWSSMALGPIGMLLGWTPMLKNKVKKQATANLEKFVKNMKT